MKSSNAGFNPAGFNFVKAIALSFPGAEESVSYDGTPSVKVRGKLMCRLHDSGEFIPIRLDFELRDHYLDTYPEIFHLPDHYKAYPSICMWANTLNKKLVTEVLELSWKKLANKKQLAEYNNRG